MISYLLAILRQAGNAVALLSSLRREVAELKRGQSRIETTLQSIQSQLGEVINALLPGPAVEVILCSDLEGVITYGVTMENLRNDQTIRLFVQPVDKKGNPAAIEAPTWNVSNSELATLAVAESGLEAILTPAGPLGTLVVSFEADGDLGSGVKKLAAATDVQIASGAAVTLVMGADAPVDVEEAEPTPGARARRTR